MEHKRFCELAELIVSDKRCLKYLQRLLYNRGELICWRAIEGFGWAARKLAGADPELVRDILRRQIWSANDESGGIGWSAPQVMAEIIYHCPRFFKEYASIVISFLDEIMLRPGVVWGAGRMAQASPDLAREFVPQLAAFADDPDPVVRGYTLGFLGIMGAKIEPEILQKLAGDNSIVPVYENGDLYETTVGKLTEDFWGRVCL